MTEPDKIVEVFSLMEDGWVVFNPGWTTSEPPPAHMPQNDWAARSVFGRVCYHWRLQEVLDNPEIDILDLRLNGRYPGLGVHPLLTEYLTRKLLE